MKFHLRPELPPKWIAPLTWAMRLAVGGLFLFAGFVKAVDPWGTLYKTQDYMAALHISLPVSVVLVGVFLLFGAEFVTGVFLCFGCCRRATPWIAAAFMAVMLPLTAWIALTDPVADCGCFGDAWVISNTTTFWKNVLLSLGVIWLIKFSPRCRALVAPNLQWLAYLVSGVYIVAIGLYGYIQQPLIDFRPYPEGSMLLRSDAESYSGSAENMVFVYEKEGQRKEFDLESVPDEADGWTFVERHGKTASDDQGALRIWDLDGTEDLTDSLADEAGNAPKVWLLFPNLRAVSIASTYQINALVRWCRSKDIEVAAVLGSSGSEAERWADLAMPDYPLYTAEDTSIKEVARGNPSVAYTEGNKIIWKSTLRALPANRFETGGASSLEEFERDDTGLLRNLTLLWLVCMAALVGMSLLPALIRLYRHRR